VQGTDEAFAEGEPLGRADNAFLAAVSSHDPAIIAEVKMGSPRLGSLHGRVDPVTQARTYAETGAAALSGVVEPDFFHGGYDLLTLCKRACRPSRRTSSSIRCSSAGPGRPGPTRSS
jgi:indole-3-glycerol phosphate synthase